MKDELKKAKIPFTQIPNALLNDKNISTSAKGIYAFMFSKPEGWNFTLKSMAKQLNESMHKMRKGLRELKASNWVSYSKKNDGTGVYSLYSMPNVDIQHKPNVDIQHKPNVDIRKMRNTTRISNKDNISNKDILLLQEKLKNNFGLIEITAMQNKLKPETVTAKIKEFAMYCSATEKIHNNDTDLYTHFGSWIRKQNLSDIDIDVEFDWFINKFNEISKREFVGTDEIRNLFAVQLNNNFTGPQMATAISNLYSSSIKNKWHKQHNYQFATPTHLLKDDNLNKYLNAKY